MENPRLNYGSGWELVCLAVTAAAPQCHSVRGGDTAPASWTSTAPGVHRRLYMPQAGSVPSLRAGSVSQTLFGSSVTGLVLHCPRGSQPCISHTDSTQGKQTPQISHRHKDAGKHPSSGFGGVASQLGVEPMQLPSERGAQTGPIFCSITHPATLGVLQRKHCPHMLVLQGCSQLLAFRDAGWVTVPDIGGRVWE